uniref:Methyltransferase domain-containing protein n=1 Tax=Archaeoglobus fulgidus TaxID=2234 RepID=A0A7C2S5X7_ARCFL
MGKYTKAEVIGVVFSKLKPDRNKIFADIGCGSGGVTEFFAPYVAKAYAVDSSIEAVKQAQERLRRFENVLVICSDGKEFLETNEVDLVFFGGTKGIESMLEVCKAERVVVNAARIDVALKVADKMRVMGIFEEILIVNVAKSYELAGGLAFRPLNPVFIVCGRRDL